MGQTSDYVLDRPATDDRDQFFAIDSDPRVWTHLPSGRLTDEEEAEAILVRLASQWELDGIGPWMVRRVPGGEILGYCGCSLATAVSLEMRSTAAGAVDPALPVVAYLLEANAASAVVARRLGLELVHRAPDAGNPDPTAVRLVFADRDLTAAQLDATLA
jgi:RimJ/RimL family protein N-acetyltransferase